MCVRERGTTKSIYIEHYLQKVTYEEYFRFKEIKKKKTCKLTSLLCDEFFYRMLRDGTAVKHLRTATTLREVDFRHAVLQWL